MSFAENPIRISQRISDFQWQQLTHHEIYQGGHGDDKKGVKVSEQVSLCRKNGVEVAAKGDAGEIGDCN